MQGWGDDVAIAVPPCLSHMGTMSGVCWGFITPRLLQQILPGRALPPAPAKENRLALAVLVHLAGSSCQLVSMALLRGPRSAWEKQLLLNSWGKQPIKSGMADPKAWGAYVKQAWQLPGNAPLGAHVGKRKNAKLLKLRFGAGSTPHPGNLLPPWTACQTMSKHKAKTWFLREIHQKTRRALRAPG